MAKAAPGFTDKRGHFHASAERAVLSDITAILGSRGSASLAHRILQNRFEIEEAFAQFDQLTGGSDA